jgi:hypothetical protein
MLGRVSGVAAFQTRAATETAAILGSPATYPVVDANADNIQIKVFDLNSPLNSTGFRTGLEDWDGNLAGKAMIDHMNTNVDPRRRAMFEPGPNAAGGAYIGLDPMANSSTQTALVAGGTLARYNRSTISRNQYFPGVLINASEVSFLIAEAYLKAGNNTSARTAYNNGIAQSIENYYLYRTVSNDNTAGALTALNPAEVTAYQAMAAVNWDLAATTADKLKLIATQKWIDFSVIQPLESWAEIRRQQLPPTRWLYATSEATYNTVNYSQVKAKDNLTTRIFWDN